MKNLEIITILLAVFGIVALLAKLIGGKSNNTVRSLTVEEEKSEPKLVWTSPNGDQVYHVEHDADDLYIAIDRHGHIKSITVN